MNPFIENDLDYVKAFLRKQVQYFEQKIDEDLVLKDGKNDNFRSFAEAKKCLEILDVNSEIFKSRIAMAEKGFKKDKALSIDYSRMLLHIEKWKESAEYWKAMYFWESKTSEFMTTFLRVRLIQTRHQLEAAKHFNL